MIAEIPVGIAILVASPERRTVVIDYLFSTPIAFVGIQVLLLGFVLLVGWLAHRLGFGC